MGLDVCFLRCDSVLLSNLALLLSVNFGERNLVRSG